MKYRAQYLGLLLLLSACVPESVHYYAPMGDGKVTARSRCGGPNEVMTFGKDGIEVQTFVDIGNWDSFEKDPNRSLRLTLLFSVPEGHTLKIMSDAVQVTVDGEPAPHQAHLVSPSFCGKELNQCSLTIGEDVAGGAMVRTWDGRDIYNPKKSMIGAVEIPDMKVVPKMLDVVLPPMRFDGEEQGPEHIGFKLESGTYSLAVNGC